MSGPCSPSRVPHHDRPGPAERRPASSRGGVGPGRPPRGRPARLVARPVGPGGPPPGPAPRLLRPHPRREQRGAYRRGHGPRIQRRRRVPALRRAGQGRQRVGSAVRRPRARGACSGPSTGGAWRARSMPRRWAPSPIATAGDCWRSPAMASRARGATSCSTGSRGAPGRPRATSSPRFRGGGDPPRPGHTDVVNALVFTPDGRFLASAGHDGTIRISGTSPTSRRRTSASSGATRAPSNALACVRTARGVRLASGGIDGHVRVWDLDGTSAGPRRPARPGRAQGGPEGGRDQPQLPGIRPRRPLDLPRARERPPGEARRRSGGVHPPRTDNPPRARARSNPWR